MSAYRYVVYLRSSLCVFCGGLVMTDIFSASYLIGFLLTFCVLFIFNPLTEREDFEKAMNYNLLIKVVAAMGSGVLMLLTRSKIVNEG